MSKTKIIILITPPSTPQTNTEERMRSREKTLNKNILIRKLRNKLYLPIYLCQI